MNSDEAKYTPASERALFRRLADGDLGAEEFHELEERLLKDAGLRARYARHMGLEASLYEVLQATESSTPVSAVGAPRRNRRWRSWPVVASAICVLLLAAAVILTRPPRPEPALQVAEAPPARQQIADAESAAPNPSSGFAEVQLHGVAEIAIVTHVEGWEQGAGRSPLLVGARLKPGILTLDRGLIELEFVQGAQLVVQGPAELHLLTDNSVSLVSGQARAWVPESAKGFSVETPDTAVVDLGTEFAVSVDRNARSEVQVIDGEVELSLLGDDGNTLMSERVREAGAVRVNGPSNALESVNRATFSVPGVRSRAARALPTPAEYVQVIRDAQPLIYYRFEAFTDETVPNEMGPRWPARRQGDVSAIAIEKGAARFMGEGAPRCIGPVEPIPGLNADSYSYELWVNPEKLHWATLVATIPEGDDWPEVYHLNVIELAHRTSLVHLPGAFRFLHRHPPHMKGGVNLFSSEWSTPGQWHHVAAVKTPNELKFYVNGRLARRVEDKIGTSGELAYFLVLGQLKENTPVRHFVGSLDEFALYLRPLTDAEVRRHYELVVPPQEN